MTDTSTRPPAGPSPETVDRVIIRFAGDSGDGMQLTGDRFTSASALFGNDLATLPDFPAEIRAPAGTIAGVSAFQVHISDHEITTPGDAPDVLVAMNPAALRSDLHRLRRDGAVILNIDAFTDAYEDTGTLGVYAGTAAADAAKTLRVVLDEAERLAAAPCTCRPCVSIV